MQFPRFALCSLLFARIKLLSDAVVRYSYDSAVVFSSQEPAKSPKPGKVTRGVE